MSEKFCPNCNFENGNDDNFCQECGSHLDLADYIESKKLDKTFTQKVKSFFGNKHIDKLNNEIEEFIKFSYDLKISDNVNGTYVKNGELYEYEGIRNWVGISDIFGVIIDIHNDGRIIV
ncbi:zinc ribbon domain-containing protein [Methanobrevibacter sp.]|uniref:zinc ribbon domain-containing protein n=1 Tax=Methanobrevibacter sp. TaxID=66852 RepID=UPI0026E0216A|nr:zinc ribbon domain-containing protein [Methanobrevibacter sp.]MDO5824340.1 zinc-ribbon domain-containing protein [Methanobrevibacter sp.]